jgi:hypothetical protein
MANEVTGCKLTHFLSDAGMTSTMLRLVDTYKQEPSDDDDDDEEKEEEEEWMASSGPSDYRKPSTHEDRSRREFLAELRSKGSRIICLNDDSGEDACFAFKQKCLHGPLHPLTKRSAKAAASAWHAGPKPSMSWRRFILMSQTHFTTARHCFPCWAWGSKGGCYHQDAVREHRGLPPLTDPKDRKTSQSKGRGRKRRAKARHFSAADRPSSHKKKAHRSK